jgi:death-on-curing family protein
VSAIRESVVFLTREDVEEMHDAEVRVSGGLRGVRVVDALESAVAQPRQVHHYAQGDLVDMAATYLYSIAMNHPFNDGNKRTAYMSCLPFLALNGIELGAPTPLEVALLATANNLLDKPGLTGILRQLVILAKEDPNYFAATYCRDPRDRRTPRSSDVIADG